MSAASTTTPTLAFRSLGDAGKLAENDVIAYYVEDLKHRVAVARIAGRLHAFDDLYEGYPLSGGLLSGSTLMSQFDGSQFDVATGAVLRGPATATLDTYEVREQGGLIEVRI
jgi:nitrite reductase/ring-hydroxylating ferredoxin subunit